MGVGSRHLEPGNWTNMDHWTYYSSSEILAIQASSYQTPSPVWHRRACHSDWQSRLQSAALHVAAPQGRCRSPASTTTGGIQSWRGTSSQQLHWGAPLLALRVEEDLFISHTLNYQHWELKRAWPQGHCRSPASMTTGGIQSWWGTSSQQLHWGAPLLALRVEEDLFISHTLNYQHGELKRAWPCQRCTEVPEQEWHI